jgi:hypothetical protein
MAGSRKRRDEVFDFRLAVCERERAIHDLESLLQQSLNSGEEPDYEFLSELMAIIDGLPPNQSPRWMVA